MARNIFLKYIYLVLLLPLTARAAAENNYLNAVTVDGNRYYPLHELIQSFKIDNSFDHLTQKGRLYNKHHQATYSIGFSYMVIDGRLNKSSYPVIRRRGEVLLPEIFIGSIINALYPSVAVHLERGRISFGAAGDEGPIRPETKEVRPKETRDRISFIIIDPGHGGKDPGAIGKGNIKEKNITLKIARYLEEMLGKNLKGIKIKATRDNDVFIELSQRADLANRMLKEKSNGLFISIHVNASLSGRTSGFETYFLSQNPTNEEARNTAALENDVIIFEDKKEKRSRDADHIEAMMLTTQIQKESSLLAESVQNGMADKISRRKSRGVRKADFFVLRGALMAAVLVEVGFITNSRESANLVSQQYQKRIAQGVSEGIVKFIKKYNSSINK